MHALNDRAGKLSLPPFCYMLITNSVRSLPAICEPPPDDDKTEDKTMARFRVNGKEQELDIEPDMPLLWALRDELGLTGTKFGCGVAACGACTVQVNGNPVRSCVTPVSAVEGSDITTIEGLAVNAVQTLTPVQQAWIDHQVPQCGYCQSGMIMAVSALLANNPSPSDTEIDGAISNVCRCGTYPRIRQAIRSLRTNA